MKNHKIVSIDTLHTTWSKNATWTSATPKTSNNNIFGCFKVIKKNIYGKQQQQKNKKKPNIPVSEHSKIKYTTVSEHSKNKYTTVSEHSKNKYTTVIPKTNIPQCRNIPKSNIPQCRNIPKTNIKIVERGKTVTHNTRICDRYPQHTNI